MGDIEVQKEGATSAQSTGGGVVPYGGLLLWGWSGSARTHLVVQLNVGFGMRFLAGYHRLSTQVSKNSSPIIIVGEGVSPSHRGDRRSWNTLVVQFDAIPSSESPVAAKIGRCLGGHQNAEVLFIPCVYQFFLQGEK